MAIKSWLQQLEQKLSHDNPERHGGAIRRLAEWIAGVCGEGEKASLVFICTHNSRRSQFAQTWCRYVQDYLDLDVADAFSGGTEVTACNERTVAALRRTGLHVTSEGTENPVYTLSDPAKALPSGLKLWSKRYDDDSNPSGTFAAVMTCDHADANCPFIPGAALRVPLTYTDPKYADDTSAEQRAYDETCRIIATDMIRLFRETEKLLNTD